MNERIDLDVVLRGLEEKLSKKIDSFDPDRHLEMIIEEKDREIARLRTLPENRKILERIKDFEAIESSRIYKTTKAIRGFLFRNPITRYILYILRKKI